MIGEIVVSDVAARHLAAVRRRVRSGEVGAAWKPTLDLVWAVLHRTNGLWTGGHNTFVYHHPAQRDDPMDVDFGVEVGRTFEPDGEVRPAQTPAGRVVSTVHAGPYSRLIEAHDAIHAWAEATGRTFGGVSWEIYDDPGPDPGALAVQVVYLLADR